MLPDRCTGSEWESCWSTCGTTCGSAVSFLHDNWLGFHEGRAIGSIMWSLAAELSLKSHRGKSNASIRRSYLSNFSTPGSLLVFPVLNMLRFFLLFSPACCVSLGGSYKVDKGKWVKRRTLLPSQIMQEIGNLHEHVKTQGAERQGTFISTAPLGHQAIPRASRRQWWKKKWQYLKVVKHRRQTENLEWQSI